MAPKTNDPLVALRELEVVARRLEVSEEELGGWLSAAGSYSSEFLRLNRTGPAYTKPGAVPLRTSTPTAEPGSFDQALAEFNELVIPRGVAPTSGRFFGYIPGGGLTSAAIGDYLAALTNRYSGTLLACPGAVEVENSMVRWMIEMVDYPREAWGTLQSGGTLATLAAVVAARGKQRPEDLARCVIYRTDEIHLVAPKSLHIAGLGHVAARSVPMDDSFRMSVPDLERAIRDDIAAGLRPWLVFASAGTVNSGAVDPLDAIADVCRTHGLWLHVDGAYGGFFLLTEKGRLALKGMGRADSIVLDPHKGLFLPYGCGAVLVRNGEDLRRGFSFRADYLPEPPADADPSPMDYSPELTRHFRGLRLWLSLKLHGVERFRAALEEKLLLADFAYRELAALPGIEVGPKPQLSIATFRMRGEGNEATERLLARVLERGRVHMSGTILRGRFYIRICVLCFRSHLEDVRICLDEIRGAPG